MNDPRSLLAQADKTVASASSGFSFFGRKSDKLEQAADMYVQAANAFRVGKQYHEAAQTFEKAATIQQQISEPNDAAASLVEAFRAYDNAADPQNAVRVIAPAIQTYTLNGNFRRAANYKKDLGDIYKDKLYDNKAALQEYRTAGDWYRGDNANALASKMFLLCAELLGKEKEYEHAVAAFEEGIELLADSVKRFSAAGYALNALICSLCNGDLIDTKKKIAEYEERGYFQPGQKELLLANNLVQAVEEQSEQMYSDHLFNYNQVAPLDKWKTELLLRVKSNMQPAVHEETGEVDLS